MTLPLSKALDPADFDQLVEELLVVDRYFTSAREQHPMRRWEYAMALRVLSTFMDGSPPPQQLVDVGGGGSPFWRMLVQAQASPRVQVIDPEENCDLATHLLGNPPLQNVVFCLSVLEHVDDLDRFLYHLGCLTAPGGLLFLTMDCCGCLSPHNEHETHHFHWMRKRIFTIGEVRGDVGEPLLDYGFSLFGAHDLTWSGAHVYDYSFCSLALVKRP